MELHGYDVKQVKFEKSRKHDSPGKCLDESIVENAIDRATALLSAKARQGRR